MAHTMKKSGLVSWMGRDFVTLVLLVACLPVVLVNALDIPDQPTLTVSETLEFSCSLADVPPKLKDERRTQHVQILYSPDSGEEKSLAIMATSHSSATLTQNVTLSFPEASVKGEWMSGFLNLSIGLTDGHSRAGLGSYRCVFRYMDANMHPLEWNRTLLVTANMAHAGSDPPGFNVKIETRLVVHCPPAYGPCAMNHISASAKTSPDGETTYTCARKASDVLWDCSVQQHAPEPVSSLVRIALGAVCGAVLGVLSMAIFKWARSSRLPCQGTLATAEGNDTR